MTGLTLEGRVFDTSALIAKVCMILPGARTGYFDIPALRRSLWDRKGFWGVSEGVVKIGGRGTTYINMYPSSS